MVDIMLFSFGSMLGLTVIGANAAVLEARATTNTDLQTALPTPSGTSLLAAVQTIAAGASFDGGMKKYDRSCMVEQT